MRGSESEREHDSFTPPSRPLFKGNLKYEPKEWPATTVRKPLENVGAQEPLAQGRPTCGVGQPQGGPPGAPLGPDSIVTVTNFENLVHV